jgi:peptidylprolyl isomerase
LRSNRQGGFFIQVQLFGGDMDSWSGLRRGALAALAFLALGLTLGMMACAPQPDLSDGLFARIRTNRGTITIRLEYQKAPMTVCNFVGLAEGSINDLGGTPFYDGLTFHSVVPDFVAQGGDPLGDGTGGPGFDIPDEFHPDLRHSAAGIVAMANQLPNTNGSQFYITFKATPWLDGRYSVFGRVIHGIEVLAKLKAGDTIRSIRIIRVGQAASQFSADQASWDALVSAAASATRDTNRNTRENAIAGLLNRWPELQPARQGMFQVVLAEGAGEKTARRGDLVTLKYKAILPDGLIFESSAATGQDLQLELGVGQITLGLDRAVEGMKIGESRIVAIPPELGYGQTGDGFVPPNSFIVYELELLAIE